METVDDASDDEMDLIGSGSPPSRVIGPGSNTQAKIQAGDEEVLTSDPEELAELMANESLEKYINQFENLPTIANIVVEPRSSGKLPATPERNNFRSHDVFLSSSPTHSTRMSEDDDYTEEQATSQILPQTSSPTGDDSRYMPPRHLQSRIIEPPTGLNPLTREASIAGESAVFSPEIVREGGNQDIYQAQFAKDSPLLGSQHPPRTSPTVLPMSPRISDPLQAITSSPPLSPSKVDQIAARSTTPTATLAPTNMAQQPSSPLSSPPQPPQKSSSPVPQARNLRARTARQQHPYAFEYAHYKNSMRRAGLDDAIIRLQAIERQNVGGVHQRQPDTEMVGFIVQEDEESQDLYVPPATPPSKTVEPARPTIDMEGLLAHFGGMISDEESPSTRQDKGKGKEVGARKKPQPRIKPFPVRATVIHDSPSTSTQPLSRPGPSSSMRRLPPSSPAGSDHQAGTSRPTRQRNRKSGVPQSEPSSLSEETSKSESESDMSSLESLEAAERKRLRILHRMMPAAWVRRQAEEQQAKEKSKARLRPHSPLRPGLARTTARIRDPNEPLVLQGDSESDNDDEISRHSVTPPLPPSQSIPISPSIISRKLIRSRTSPLKRLTQISEDNDIVDLLSSDDHSTMGLNTSTIDDQELSSWLARRSPVRETGRKSGSGKGGDLINRMLSRTNGSSRTFKKTRAGYDESGRKMKQAKLTAMFRDSTNPVLEVSSSDDGAHVDHGARRTKKSNHTGDRTSGAAKTRDARKARSGRTFTLQGDLAELLDATISAIPPAKSAPSKSVTHNQAIAANTHIRAGQGQPQPSSSQRSPIKRDAFSHQSVSTDSGIIPFSGQTKFSSSTYIGRGYLQNLIDIARAKENPPIEATPVVVFGEHLDTRLTGTDFVDQVRRLAPHWTSWLSEKHNEPENNVLRSFRFVSLRTTFLLEVPDEQTDEGSFDVDSASNAFLEEDATETYKIVTTLSLADPALKNASLESSRCWLFFHWFVFELAVRIACGNRRRALRISQTASLVPAKLDAAVERMIRALLSHNLPDNIHRAYGSSGDLDDPVLEIWICLLYLIDDTEFAGATSWKPLWTRVESVLGSADFALPYKVHESERRWQHIFSFSALEAFSSQTGRILTSHPPISRWPWVCKTIKDIRLKEDNIVSEAKQRRQRVDYYVRIVTARCWLLHTMWGWSYAQPDRLLTLLYPIFQTRKLAKLRDERTDFPTFIRNLDLEHLERFSNGDTAWSIFLKIFRRNIVDNPVGARKLYAAHIPVAVLNFTDENPATDVDLSRLFNSFAMFLVVLITDPTSERGADCVGRMQSLVSFKTADMRSREACIRAFQYTGLLYKYYELDFDPIIAWMHLILQSLQDHLKGDILLAQRNRLIVLVLCLVRSVAAITSTCGFDRDSTKAYPETALLTRDFVQAIFRLDLRSNAAARREIKQFLEAFLHARDAFRATLPQKSVHEVVAEEESQESYGMDEFDLDLDDPEVLAGLDALENDSPEHSHSIDPLVARERKTAEIFKDLVSPMVFENIVLGFGLDDRRLSNSPEKGYDLGEESSWIRVWFSCARIVVENDKRSWFDYLNEWGNPKDERISRIIDVSAEHRVRLYFCYLAVKHTPSLAQRSNKERKHQLLLPWFQCLPHHRYTVEHKYTALLFDLGLKSDMLLDGILAQPNEAGEHYIISSELMAERGSYIRCILMNFSHLSQASDNVASSGAFARARTCVVRLFETMKQTWDHLNRQYATIADTELVPSYLEFCRDVRSAAEELLPAPVRELTVRLSWVPMPLP